MQHLKKLREESSAERVKKEEKRCESMDLKPKEEQKGQDF